MLPLLAAFLVAFASAAFFVEVTGFAEVSFFVEG